MFSIAQDSAGDLKPGKLYLKQGYVSSTDCGIPLLPLLGTCETVLVLNFALKRKAQTLTIAKVNF
jgi:hypothetical protein